MPDEEKVEDFISLWKKKLATDDTPSIIGDVQKENELLRKKIAENIELFTKSEEILTKAVKEKEKLKIEKDEAVAEIAMKLNDIKQENLELGRKVKSMVKVLLEKDEKIKSKDSLILNLQTQAPTKTGTDSMTESAINEKLEYEISKKDKIIQNLEKKTTELSNKVEQLNQDYREELKSKPVDYIVQTGAPEQKVIKPMPPEQKVIKPMPPETSIEPLETLCQDLQSDLTKYKRIVENLKREKTELKSALEGKGYHFSEKDLEELKKENDTLKKDLEEMQKSFSKGKKEAAQVDTKQLEIQIINLENKLREKDSTISDLKLSAISPTDVSGDPMAELVENLQKNINKLKTTINEKDRKILELNKRIAQM